MKLKLYCFALLAVLALPLGAQEQVWDDLLPTDSLTLLHERNAAVAGTWRYKGVAVELAGANLAGTLGKPLAKSKVKKPLKKALKKLGIAHKRTTLRLGDDGTWAMELRGERAVTGTYIYDALTHQLHLKWHHLSLPLTVTLDHKNRLKLLIPAHSGLETITAIAALIPNQSLRDLARLAKLYTEVDLGLELKR